MLALLLLVLTLIAVLLWRSLNRSRQTGLAHHRELERHLALVHRLLEGLEEGVAVSDGHGRVVLRNAPAAVERARGDRHDHDPADCGPLCGWLHSDQLPALSDEALPSLDLVSPSDARRQLRLSATTYGSANHPFGAVAITRDDTQLRRLEDDGRAAVDELAHLAQALRGFHQHADVRVATCLTALEVSGALQVVLLEARPNGDLQVVAQAGPPVEPFTLPTREDSPAHACLRSGAFSLVPDPSGPGLAPWRDALAGHPLGSLVLLPLPGHAGPSSVLGAVLSTALTSADSKALALLDVIAQEATLALDRQCLLDELREQAQTDALTGLPNRRTWDDGLQHELDSAARLQHAVSVAMIDLDHFKRFNDTHGHAAGDDVLRRVAAAWSPLLRTTDLLARVGGEEFAVLLPGCDEQEAQAVVRKLLTALPLGVTFSAGVAQWHGQDAHALLDAADHALYAAKAGGRNRVEGSHGALRLSS